MRERGSLEIMDWRPPAVLLRKLRHRGFERVLSLKSIGSCPRGFTLIELILSITILSMIAVIIGSGFRLGLKAWDQGDREAEAVQTMRVLSSLVSQQIKSAYPYKMEIDDEDVVVFKGEEDSMLFVTTLSSPYPGGFKWVRYLHKDGMLLYKEGILPDKELIDNVPDDEEVLETDVEEVKFEYYSDDEDEWTDSWEYSDKLPGAVKAQIGYFQPILVNIPINMGSEGEEELEGSAAEEL